MKVVATMNAGYSPKFGTTIEQGKEYDIPDQPADSLPEFFRLPTAAPAVVAAPDPEPAATPAPTTTKGGK